ncbi:MAG: SDR family NAD(P)-dependent oxidoreductase, partial [Actinomycetota bacterium]|nr:SDR family NAD(P)-dependent oxidoreductase [Actinomycetota bacterium]
MANTNPLDFTDRVVVVTGGTKGIGRTIAARFLAAGAEVLVCGRTPPEQLPGKAQFLATDVRDPEAVAALVAHAVVRWGRV